MASYQDTEVAGRPNNASVSSFEKYTDASSENDLFMPKDGQTKKVTREIWLWKVASALFAITSLLLCIVVVIQRQHSSTTSGHESLIRSSDFPPAREAIEIQEVRFTGSPAFDLNRTAYVPHPGPINYFGEPSDELDELWEELSGSYNFLLSEAEAKELWPDDYERRWDHRLNGYPMGIEMFHTLHCINQLRKLFYPEYYRVDERHMRWLHQHRNHCLDQLRQNVMCAGDMTPYGTLYYEGLKWNYADTDVTHTCRNFEKLREWTTRRYHTGGDLHMPDVEIWH